jgi:microcystin-dependent protein
MAKTAVNQFDVTPGNNTDVDGIGVGAAMTVDNTNDAFQHLMALIAQQMGEVGALAADLASAATTDLSAARGWFVNITGTNTISALGTVPAGKIFRLRMVNGLTLTYNAASMILPNATSFGAAAGDIVTMLSLGTGNWRFVDYSPAGGGALPTGSIVDFGGATAPGGWLLCNGQLVSRTGYPLLYAAIGTAYGAGDGSTTFAVPDFRGRAAIGDDLMGTTAAGRITTTTMGQTTRGGAGGLEAVALTTAQLASHAHTASSGVQSADHSHTQTGTFTTGTESADHTHSVPSGNNAGAVYAGGGFSAASIGGQTTGGRSAAHTHNVTISGQTGGISANHTHAITVDAAGSGAVHLNMPPSLICMKIIKT